MPEKVGKLTKKCKNSQKISKKSASNHKQTKQSSFASFKVAIYSIGTAHHCIHFEDCMQMRSAQKEKSRQVHNEMHFFVAFFLVQAGTQSAVWRLKTNADSATTKRNALREGANKQLGHRQIRRIISTSSPPFSNLHPCFSGETALVHKTLAYFDK